ncbi:unnamed protein product, partial [Didymodactylos carnosus]
MLRSNRIIFNICQRSSLKFIGGNRVTVVIKKKEVEAVIAAAGSY